MRQERSFGRNPWRFLLSCFSILVIDAGDEHLFACGTKHRLLWFIVVACSLLVSWSDVLTRSHVSSRRSQSRQTACSCTHILRTWLTPCSSYRLLLSKTTLEAALHARMNRTRFVLQTLVLLHKHRPTLGKLNHFVLLWNGEQATHLAHLGCNVGRVHHQHRLACIGQRSFFVGILLRVDVVPSVVRGGLH